MAALLPPQLLARAQQLAQFLELLLRNKTAANQAVGQQIGDPGRVADIGLTTGNIFDVSGIRQNPARNRRHSECSRPASSKRRLLPWPHGCNPAQSTMPARAAARTSSSR